MTQGGYHGRYLSINLTDGSWKTESLPEELTSKYIGGRGIGTRLLFDRQKGKTDPLSPESHLVIFTGPITGTNTPGSSRVVFICKSPLSNAINPASMGGSFPNALKRTGFDGLVISGASKQPVWLHITPEGVVFNSAKDEWGLRTAAAEEAIKKKAGDKCRVACIGPAGEKGVLYAAVVSETRTASRGGIGAVMGSKNLKAIAVSGDKRPPIADKEAFETAVKKFREDQEANPSVGGMQINGTAGMVSVVNAMGGLPTRNFQTGVFERAEEISGSYIAENRKVKGVACASCPVGCSLIAEVKEGAYAGTRSEGPEYESVVMLGANLMIGDLDTVIVANGLCDELGLDTISTGNVIGFAMEC
ncbi:MAG: Aldehyde ferredoxin oxidoreductase, partial [Deltaproteobacteria bacterium]|nr:Aldehyde ferredoxin oxidoreductase [Deltaproteobacteria bacterium]